MDVVSMSPGKMGNVMMMMSEYVLEKWKMRPELSWKMSWNFFLVKVWEPCPQIESWTFLCLFRI